MNNAVLGLDDIEIGGVYYPSSKSRWTFGEYKVELVYMYGNYYSPANKLTSCATKPVTCAFQDSLT